MLCRIAVFIDIFHKHLDGSMHIHTLFIVSNDGFFRTIESESFALGTRTYFCDIVKTQHHILRGNRDRCSIGRVKNVVALEHQHLCFKDGLVAQGEVNSHLVSVEVGVEGRTCKRVELDGLAFNHLGLESLNTKTVKCRSTVEQNGMSLHHMFEDVPNNRFATIHNFLRTLHGFNDAAFDEFADDERLIELGSHQFGDTTLAHLQLRTYNNNRTSRIVNTLTEKVLTETTLLTLQIV